MPELVVKIVGDTKGLEKSFDRASRSSKKFGNTMEKSGRGVAAATIGFHGLGRSVAFASGAFLGGAGFTAIAKSSISAASDLQEQMSKTNVVFGDSAKEITAWSDTTATSMGISQREALAVASSFGALFAPMGLVGPKAAEQSRALTQLGADLASFYNTDVSAALDAIRSGIVGESEPLRRYGVLLSETRVQAKALADTHKQSAKDLTAAEKAAARIALIFRDTSKATGDFARTSGGLANQSRILRAQLDDFQSNVGAFYVPGLTKMTKAANETLATFKGITEADPSPSIREQAALVPKLAVAYSDLREVGVTSGNAIKALEGYLGGTAKAADLVGLAINYAAGGPVVAKIVRLRQEIYGLGVDAEMAAKQMHGLAAATQFVAEAQPTGMAALSPTQANQLAIARAGTTPGVADNLAAQLKAREILARKIKFITGTLKTAKAGNVKGLAETLGGLYRDDAAALAEITSINEAAAAKARTAAEKVKAAAKAAREAAAAALEARQGRKLSWLQFAVERAEDTKTIKDDIAAQRAMEKWLVGRIKKEGRKFELVSDLWRARKRIRDLNKSQADVDPLAGLMQVSTRKLTNMLAAGTDLGIAGRQTLGRNIAGAQLQPLVVPVNIDGREVGRAVTKDQSRTGRRTDRQTSGFRG